MTAHREHTHPHQRPPDDAVPPVAEPAEPIPDSNRLTRRERRGATHQSGRAGKVQPGRRKGLVPAPRQYAARRRG